MVLIQNLLGLSEIEVIHSRFGPGHLHQPIEVSPNHGSLCSIRMHLLQSFQFSSRPLSQPPSGIFAFLIFWPKFFKFLGSFVHLSQFASNGPHLFSKKVFPLGLGDFIFRLGLNLCLHGENLDLFSEDLTQCLQPLDGVEDFQDLLSFFHRQVQD